MKPPRNILTKLTPLGASPDDALDVGEVALLLATASRPGVPLTPYRRHLKKLAKDVGNYTLGADRDKLALRCDALRQIVSKRYGYSGAADAFDDAEGSNMTRVIDRRRGLPVMLAILYLHAGRKNGWDIVGIAFPARFLIRLNYQGRRAILDPFDNGRFITPVDMRALFKSVAGSGAELTPRHYSASTNRETLLRVQDNAKVRLLREDRLQEALEVIETSLLFAPDVASLWHEAALLHEKLDDIPAAVACLEEYLARTGRDHGRYRSGVLLQNLRKRLN
jgi:regulator of sirC expression with transglutaminase-like and TPR domain